MFTEISYSGSPFWVSLDPKGKGLFHKPCWLFDSTLTVRTVDFLKIFTRVLKKQLEVVSHVFSTELFDVFESGLMRRVTRSFQFDFLFFPGVLHPEDYGVQLRQQRVPFNLSDRRVLQSP